MTIYEIPNIEHCDITTIGTSLYRIFAHEGWYIHLPTNEPILGIDGTLKKVYKTVAIMSVNYDFSTVEITAEADLPPNAEICGGNDNNHEIM